MAKSVKQELKEKVKKAYSLGYSAGFNGKNKNNPFDGYYEPRQYNAYIIGYSSGSQLIAVLETV